MDGAFEEVRLWDEIGVKDGDEFARGDFESIFEGTGFRAAAVVAMDVEDVEPFGGFFVDGGLGDGLCFIRGIVEDLDLEFLFWITNAADGIDEPFDDVAFVKHRQLHRHPRQFGELRVGVWNILAVEAIEGCHDKPMGPVNTEHAQEDEVKEDKKIFKHERIHLYLTIFPLPLNTSFASPSPYRSLFFFGPRDLTADLGASCTTSFVATSF